MPLFAQAKREHKFVLLDLHAVWCHWCHVMDTTTYADPKVVALIQAHYIAVSVDQDARPDLAQRYQDYGWPATVVYNGDGGEIVKRQGYLPSAADGLDAAGNYRRSVAGTVGDECEHTVISRGDSGAPDRSWLRCGKQLLDGYDAKLGGWGTVAKIPELGQRRLLHGARAGRRFAEAEKMARQTLDAQLKLIDPVWGGVDQYSAEGDWDHPHFEKIMQFQAENMRIYAAAYAQFKDPVYLKTARGNSRLRARLFDQPRRRGLRRARTPISSMANTAATTSSSTTPDAASSASRAWINTSTHAKMAGSLRR